MRYIRLLPVILLASFAISCQKSNTSPGGSVAGLNLGGTEYWGFITQEAREWPKPILLHFNADSTVIGYCDFYLLQANGTIFQNDSTIGKIISSSPGPGDSTSLTLYFKDIADTQVYNISSDLSEISGGSKHWAINNFLITSVLKNIPNPAGSLINTFWSSDSVQSYAFYPDISGTQFGANGFTSYERNGGAATYGPIPEDSIVAFKYHQYGNRVYFYGYNEKLDAGIPFFGVISDDGNTIYADTNQTEEARVPLVGVTDGEYEYGDTGITPYLKKRH